MDTKRICACLAGTVVFLTARGVRAQDLSGTWYLFGDPGKSCGVSYPQGTEHKEHTVFASEGHGNMSGMHDDKAVVAGPWGIGPLYNGGTVILWQKYANYWTRTPGVVEIPFFYNGDLNQRCFMRLDRERVTFGNEQGGVVEGTLTNGGVIASWGAGALADYGKAILWENGSYWTRVPGPAEITFYYGADPNKPCVLRLDNGNVSVRNEHGSGAGARFAGNRLESEWCGANLLAGAQVIAWDNHTYWALPEFMERTSAGISFDLLHGATKVEGHGEVKVDLGVVEITIGGSWEHTSENKGTPNDGDHGASDKPDGPSRESLHDGGVEVGKDLGGGPTR